jgi:hypothetical protein
LGLGSARIARLRLALLASVAVRTRSAEHAGSERLSDKTGVFGWVALGSESPVMPAKEAVAKDRIAAETYSFVIPAKAGI